MSIQYGVEDKSIKDFIKYPLVKASVKFKALYSVTQNNQVHGQGCSFIDKQWRPCFRRYFIAGKQEKLKKGDLAFLSNCINRLIENGDSGLEHTLSYIDTKGAPYHDYVESGIFSTSVEVLALLAYDSAEYCLAILGLTVGDTKRKLMELGYPQISVGLAIMWYLEDEGLALE